MHPERKLYTWLDIGKVPSKTGIYAWYYRHLLADHDINTLIANLTAVKGNKERENELMRDFLRTFLFDVFQEEPYHVSMSGPLKPTYQGLIPHLVTITEGLVRRMVAEPARLWPLKKVLDEAVPEFASPIYIGMSVDLNARVGRHKQLIQAYKRGSFFELSEVPTADEDIADHSFAKDVVRRGFSPNRLVVTVRVIESDVAADIHLDAENILNRINFPLCGRN
jgi:hypothetical protein